MRVCGYRMRVTSMGGCSGHRSKKAGVAGFLDRKAAKFRVDSDFCLPPILAPTQRASHALLHSCAVNQSGHLLALFQAFFSGASPISRKKKIFKERWYIKTQQQSDGTNCENFGHVWAVAQRESTATPAKSSLNREKTKQTRELVGSSIRRKTTEKLISSHLMYASTNIKNVERLKMTETNLWRSEGIGCGQHHHEP